MFQVFQALSDEPSLHHQKLHLFLQFLEYVHTMVECSKPPMSQGSTCKERTRIKIHHSSKQLLRYCEHYLPSALSFVMLALGVAVWHWHVDFSGIKPPVPNCITDLSRAINKVRDNFCRNIKIKWLIPRNVKRCPGKFLLFNNAGKVYKGCVANKECGHCEKTNASPGYRFDQCNLPL